MGACLSGPVEASETPKCRLCGTHATAPWRHLGPAQRAAWVYDDEKTLCCRKCVLSAKMQRIQYEQEREAYKEAAAEMYPKPSASLKVQGSQLRRVNSGERWDGTTSFKSRYEPPSALKEVLEAIKRAQEEDPKLHVGVQRRPMGFIPPTVPSPLSGPAQQQQTELAAAASTVTAQVHEQLSLDRYQTHFVRQLSGVEEEQELASSSTSRISLRYSMMRQASAAASWAVAEVAREAAEREAAVAAASAGVEQEEDEEQQAAREADEAAEEWQRRRMLWQLHHTRSKLLSPCGDDAGSDSEDELGALGDSAYSLEGDRPRVSAKVKVKSVEVPEVEAPHPTGVRCY